MGIILQRIDAAGTIHECVIESWEGVEATGPEMLAILKSTPELASQLMHQAEVHGLAWERLPHKTYVDNHHNAARINIDTLEMRNVVVPLKPKDGLYNAKLFTAQTEPGEWKAAGTVCGHIDFVIPGAKITHCISPDEAQAIIVMLTNARADVLENSNPNGDPRLYDRS